MTLAKGFFSTSGDGHQWGVQDIDMNSFWSCEW